MYRDAYQRGMLTIFFSGGSKPLEIWETKTRDGYIKRFLDPEIKTMVLEIRGHNISTTYMSCPKGNQVLGITMPFLVMIVKNLNKYFSFEVTVLDSTGTRRRFRVSNFQSTTQILPLCTVMPIGLASGWNQIQFNLAEFTRRAYKNQFLEVQKLKINANIRIRRIYFTEKLMSDDELPVEYKLYFPLQQKGPKGAKERETDKENVEFNPQDKIQEKKLSVDNALKPGSVPSKPGLKDVSVSAVKKSRKSLQTVSEPVGTEVVKEGTTIDEKESVDHPQTEELPEGIIPSGEEQAPGEETAVTESEPGVENEEKNSASELDADKEDKTLNQTETDVNEDETKTGEVEKGEEDNKLSEEENKGEGEKNPDNEDDKGEGDKKPDEEENKGEGDKKPDEEENKGEGDKKPDEEENKGEGDKKPDEEGD